MSIVWKYFDKVGNDVDATCKICQNKYSYKTSVSNLRKHLNYKHKDAYIMLSEQILDSKDTDTKPFTDNSDSEESINLDPDNELWGFFDKEPGNNAKCSMCATILRRHPDNLYKHLKEQHSRVSETLDFKDYDESYTEVIYLEDPVAEAETVAKKTKYEENTGESKRKRPKRRYSHREPLKVNNHQEQEKKIDKCEQEIENFGKYITGLLKGIPKHACTKLQLDIVDLIMTSKLNNLENTPTITTNGTIESQSDNDQKKENLSTVENREKEPAEDSNQDSKNDPKLDPKDQNIPIPKKRHKSICKEEMYNDLTESDEKEIENFGNYVTTLLQTVKNKETSTKLQLVIVDLIMSAKLGIIQKNAPSLTVNIENKEILIETKEKS